MKRLPLTLYRLLHRWELHLGAGGILGRLGVSRHSVGAVLLPAILLALLVLGTPTVDRWPLAASVGLITALSVALLARWTEKRGFGVGLDVAMQIVLVVSAALLIFAMGNGDTFHRTRPYRHVFLLVAGAAAASLSVASWGLLRRVSGLAPGALFVAWIGRTRVFRTPLGGRRPGSAVAIARVIRAPLLVLAAPSIAVVSAATEFLYATALFSLLAWITVLSAGAMEPRLGLIWRRLNDVLYRGSAALVTIAVLILALLRLAGVLYLTTVLDGAHGVTILTWVASAYAVALWLDYWLGRLTAEAVLRLSSAPFGPTTSLRRTRLYGARRIAVARGFARWAVLDCSTSEFLSRLDSAPPSAALTPRPTDLLNRTTAIAFLGHLCLSSLLVVVGVYIHYGEQIEEARTTAHSGEELSLDELFDRNAKATRLYGIAASGGGTRAALFTAAAMEAIRASDGEAQVLMGSGVSGGAAALAYFAANQDALWSGEPSVWNAYIDAMNADYIGEVLDRATEWRMLCGGRLGTALADAFDARWNLTGRSMSQVKSMGLLLNASLAAEYHSSLGHLRGHQSTSYASRDGAGARVVLTNLDAALVPDDCESPSQAPRLGSAPCRRVIGGCTIPLATAAALSANFPPVFSDAAIDIDGEQRLWVTDGGAVDNLGVETLLTALLTGLRQRAALPDLRIVVLDASALPVGFSQDRGLGSMRGSGSKFAKLLNIQLVNQLESLYKSRSTAHQPEVIYVPMPSALCDGAFGTHWMPQERTRIVSGPERTDFTASEIAALIRGLFSTDPPTHCRTEFACKQLRSDRAFSEGWSRVNRKWKPR